MEKSMGNSDVDLELENYKTKEWFEKARETVCQRIGIDDQSSTGIDAHHPITYNNVYKKC